MASVGWGWESQSSGRVPDGGDVPPQQTQSSSPLGNSLPTKSPLGSLQFLAQRLHAEAVAVGVGPGGDPLSLVNASCSVWTLWKGFPRVCSGTQRPWSDELCSSMYLITEAKISIIDHPAEWLRAVFANREAESQLHISRPTSMHTGGCCQQGPGSRVSPRLLPPSSPRWGGGTGWVR